MSPTLSWLNKGAVRLVSELLLPNFAILAREYFARFYFRDFNAQI